MGEMRVLVQQLKDGRWYAIMESRGHRVQDTLPTREDAYRVVRRRLRMWAWGERMSKAYPEAKYLHEVPPPTDLTAQSMAGGASESTFGNDPGCEQVHFVESGEIEYFDEPPATIDWAEIMRWTTRVGTQDGDMFRRGGR